MAMFAWAELLSESEHTKCKTYPQFKISNNPRDCENFNCTKHKVDNSNKPCQTNCCHLAKVNTNTIKDLSFLRIRHFLYFLRRGQINCHLEGQF